MKLDIILKFCINFTLNFKIEGIVKLEPFEKLMQDEKVHKTILSIK